MILSDGTFCLQVKGRSHADVAPFGGVSNVNGSPLEYQGLLSRDESESLLMHHQHLMSASAGNGPSTSSYPRPDVELRNMRANSVPAHLSRPNSGGKGGSYHNSNSDSKPDLLLTDTVDRSAAISKSATPLNPNNLMQFPSPAPSTVSSVLTNASLRRTGGTVPMQHQASHAHKAQ